MKNREMAKRGRAGGLKGGKARAKKLSAKRRREIARKGGLARNRKTGAAQGSLASQRAKARAGVAPREAASQSTRQRAGVHATIAGQPLNEPGAAQTRVESQPTSARAGEDPERPEGDVRQVKEFIDRGMAAQAAVDKATAEFTPKPVTPGHGIHCQCVRCRSRRAQLRKA